jgi:hypothetical protein
MGVPARAQKRPAPVVGQPDRASVSGTRGKESSIVEVSVGSRIPRVEQPART